MRKSLIKAPYTEMAFAKDRHCLSCLSSLYELFRSWVLAALLSICTWLIYIKFQIKSIFQTIGACLMAIVNGIGAVLQAIIAGIVSLFDIIISCLTCGRGGGRRGGGRSAV